MVAATCYAWLLENKNIASRKEAARNDNFVEFVVPVMNMRRGKMWKQRQAAWLFNHAGLDASSLLFSNEVDQNSSFCFCIDASFSSHTSVSTRSTWRH